jgi:hypothetical protein
MLLPLLHDKVAATTSDKLVETTSDKVAEGASGSYSTSDVPTSMSCSISSGFSFL